MDWFEQYLRSKGLGENEEWHEGSGLCDHMCTSANGVKNTKVRVVRWEKAIYNTQLVGKSLQLW